MEPYVPSISERLAEAAMIFQKQLTGHAPKSASAVLSEDTLVITLRGALSPAEAALSRTPEGAAKVREFHRVLFNDSQESLRNEIRRITGVEVSDAAAEVESSKGAVVHSFTTGTVVQVFQLAHNIAPESWSGTPRPIPA